MRVPFIDLSRSVNLIADKVKASWNQVLENKEFVGGPTVTSLERKLEQKLAVDHFIACSNGTDALVVGLQALGIKPGMRVALPNMTFWAPYEAIVQIGAIPILVDIDPDDLQMSFSEFKTGHKHFHFDAAILVHLFGWTSHALLEFRQFCSEENITLLEDGAQSFGVEYDKQPIYGGATLSTISFYPAKVLGGATDGGGVMTPHPTIGEKIRALCNHGRAGHYTYDYVGWNNRMSGLNAHYLNHMLEEIDSLVASRVEAEAFYRNYFADYSSQVQVHKAPDRVTGNGYLSVITVKKKSADELVASLMEEGVGSARTYPQTLCQQPPAKRALRTSDLRHSISFSRNVINLPLFGGITLEECEVAAQALQKLL